MNEKATREYLNSRRGEVVRVIDADTVETFGFLEYNASKKRFRVEHSDGRSVSFAVSDVININRLQNQIFVI